MSDEIFYHASVTLGVVSRLELRETTATPSMLEWRVSDGRTFSYPRDPIDIGDLKFSYRALANGKYFYRYTFDNRLVQMVRVGEFEHVFGFGRPDLRCSARMTR